MTIVRVLSATAAVALSLSLASCVLEPGSATPEPSQTASSTPSASPVLPEPISIFDVSCQDLVAEASIQSLVGDHGPLETSGVSATYRGMQEAAVLADAGLSCTWPTLVSGLAIPSVKVTALADAEGLFARLKPTLIERPAIYMPAYTEFDLFESTLVECLDYYVGSIGYVCKWQILVDDIWLAIDLGGVPATDVYVPVPRENPDTSLKPIEPIVEGSQSLTFVSAIVETLREAPRRDVNRRSIEIPACTTLVDTSALQVMASGPLEINGDGAPEVLWENPNPATIGDFSMERAGFKQCVVYSPLDHWGVQFRVAPDVNWLLKPPFSVPPGTLSVVEGLGEVYTECYSGEGESGCSLTVVGSGAMIAIYMYDSQDSQISLEVARSVLAALPD